MNKYIIRKMILFITLLLFEFKMVSEVLTPKWNYPLSDEQVGMILSGLERLRECPDVIFGGTSHMSYQT